MYIVCISSIMNCQFMPFSHYSVGYMEKWVFQDIRKLKEEMTFKDIRTLTLPFSTLCTCGLDEMGLVAGGPDINKHLLKRRPSAHRHMCKFHSSDE